MEQNNRTNRNQEASASSNQANQKALRQMIEQQQRTIVSYLLIYIMILPKIFFHSVHPVSLDTNRTVDTEVGS